MKCYLNPASCSNATASPEAHKLSQDGENAMGTLYVGQKVITQYGRGSIVEKRSRDVVVEIDPDCWVLAYGQRPRLFLHPTQVKRESSTPPLIGGEEVDTPFGAGYMLSRRAGKDGQVIVESGKGWLLANGE